MFAAAIGDVAAGAAGFAAAIGDVAAAIGDVAVGGGDRRRCSGILVLRCNWVWRRRTVGCEFLVLC